MAKKKGTRREQVVRGRVFRGDEEPETMVGGGWANDEYAQQARQPGETRSADQIAADYAAQRVAEHMAAMGKRNKMREHRESQKRLREGGPSANQLAYQEAEAADAAKKPQRPVTGETPLDLLIGRGRPVTDLDAYPQSNVPQVSGEEPIGRNRTGHAGMGAGEARR